jgi:acyl-CoA thioesterase FadM
MGWATYGRGIWALTGKIEVRFREAAPTGERLELRGRMTRERGRVIEAMAELRNIEGKILAEANGVLFRASGEQAQLIEKAARARIEYQHLGRD